MADLLSSLDSIERVRVSCKTQEVGTIAMTGDGCMAFQYSRPWLASGFSISPLSLPLEERVFIAKPSPLDGVFGVFADSLPDGWGRLLVDRMLSSNGIDPARLSPLARLSIVGSTGAGALEYEPETVVSHRFDSVDLDRLSEECRRILETEYSDDLDQLFALGGSSGGARPKILTAIDGEDWIIKFPSSYDSKDVGKEEYELSLLARECGIAFPESRLFESKTCGGYFGVKRFDRVCEGEEGSKKVFMVSAGALLETSHRIPNLEYETLFRLTSTLTESMQDIERLYRLMCFNVLVGNRDDHSKNFSYLYEDQTGWTLSPAYDITVNPGMHGEHATTVNGKGKSILLEDLVEVGASAGLSRAKARRIAEGMRARVEAAGYLVRF